jgi:tetratricopeptide (TPR) repeat protein
LLELSGRLLSYTGDLEQAEQTFLKAGHLYNQQNDMAGYAHVLALLATIFNQHGKTTEAVELCQEALEIAETMSDDILVANINLSLSDIYIRGRNWREGLVAAQKAYTIYQNTEAPRYVTQALINLFAIWATLEEWKEIESHTGELLNLLAESGEIHRLSQLKNNLGIAAYNQNNYVKAESEWQEALQLHSQIQEPSELASLYNNLGLVYTKTGEWEAALEMLQKSVGAFKKLGDVFRWANSLDNLADLYEAQGNTAASRQALKEAITGLKSIDPSPPTQELLSEMEAHLARLAKA